MKGRKSRVLTTARIYERKIVDTSFPGKEEPSAAKLRTEKSQHDKIDVIGAIEFAALIIIVMSAITLHVVLFLNSGSLWRDEVNSLNLSLLPTLSDVWNLLQFDSSPVLWFLILRGWNAIGFGQTDQALRMLGLSIGLGVFSTLWLVARNLGVRYPFVSFVLFGLCPTVFWGDSLRAFGLGIILILLAMGSMWLGLKDPRPSKMFLSLVTAILSVQCLYHSAFILFAICIGGVAVGLYHRRLKLILFPLGVGAISAVSLVPYYSTIMKAGSWTKIIQTPISTSLIIRKFDHAIDPSNLFLSWVWLALFLVSIFVFSRVLISSSSGRSAEQKPLMLFLLVTILVSVVSYLTFIRILSYPTQVWYYLPLMAVLSVVMDKGVDAFCQGCVVGRWLRFVLIAGCLTLTMGVSWNTAQTRRTNLDLVSAKLESIAARDDLIVVFPFYYGITFGHYYKGTTRWVTLPDIDDHRVHRYDLIKNRMTHRKPVEAVIQCMRKTLRNGNRVWLVGSLDFLPPGEKPRVIAPAPNSPYGWNKGIYEKIWSQKAAYVIQKHGQVLRQIRVPVSAGPVSTFEDVPLFVVDGWRQ